MILILVLLLAIALITIGVIMPWKKRGKKAIGNSVMFGSGIGLFAVMLIIALSVHFSMVTKSIHLEEVYDTALAYASEEPSDVLIIDTKLLDHGLSVEPFGRSTLSGGYTNTIAEYNKDLYQLRGLSRDIWLSFLAVAPRNDLRPIILK